MTIKSTATSFVSFVFLLLFFVAADLSPVSAQRRRVRRAGGHKTAATGPSPANGTAVRMGEIQKVIGDKCTAMKEIITTANVSYSEFPFEEIAAAADFDDTCTADGTITWTAQRKFSSEDNVSATYLFSITLNVAELNLGRLDSDHGVVHFVSGEFDKPKIKVSGQLSELQAIWWLDLRREDYARKFNEAVRDLARNLAEKNELMKSD